MLHYAGAPFSMTNPCSHSKHFFCVIPNAVRNPLMDASLRWRFAQHDKTEDVIPSISFVSFRAPARNPLMDASLRWRFVQHDKPVQSFQAFLLCHSKCSEESTHGCFASLSMTRPKMSFRAFLLCHSERSEESTHGCFTALALRSA